jgi:uncharacterized protein
MAALPSSAEFLGRIVDLAQLTLIFTSIIYEAMPFVVLGVVLAGILEEFVPQQLVARFIPKRKLWVFLAILVGGLLGLPFPMCECGIIPVMRRLLRKGVPLSVCVTYILAGPIINIVVILSTMAAFSGQMIAVDETHEIPQSYAFVTMRCGLGYIIAVITGIIVEWMHRKYGNELLAPSVIKDSRIAAAALDDDGAPVKTSLAQKLGNITDTAMHDFIDIMAFLVLGAAIAAFGRLIIPQLNVEDLIGKNPVIAILIMMAFAVAFCLCSEADAFVAANFQPVGLWPLSSKLSFLVLGPMLDFKLFMMYTRVFRYRLIFTIIASVVLQTFVYCVVVHYITTAWLK